MKKKLETEECNIHIMPPSISDDDISALFNGLINIVKRKTEMDLKAEIINSNIVINKVIKELNEKKAECNRLKNEILFLKSELDKKSFNL